MKQSKSRFSSGAVVTFTLTVAILFLLTRQSLALEPGEVLVLANKEVSESIDLAKYYMKNRSIPDENLIILSASPKEHIRGNAYDRDIVGPVREYLKNRNPFMPIRCVVLMYGIPLKVNRPQLPETRAQLNVLKGKRDDLKKQIDSLKKGDQKRALQDQLKTIKNKMTALQRANRSASVDSEIALVHENYYTLEGWIPNPLFLGYRDKRVPGMPGNALMVSRLDGPTADVVRRIIDDTLAAEEKGLQGIAYFDARWPKPDERKKSGYGFFDQSIHEAANLLKKKGIMPVVLDAGQPLFQPGDCPGAALYCGWYSLKKYVDAFQWQPGAVGYHIASGECATLKKPESRVWCKVMIEKGVAATLGPVSEPYVEAFPPPAVFFALLVDGKLTLAECYAAANPFLSWKMVLIGDPLYRPFKM